MSTATRKKAAVAPPTVVDSGSAPRTATPRAPRTPKADKPRSTTSSSSTSKSPRTPRTPRAPRAPRTSTSSGADFGPGKAKYASGEFGAAVDSFDSIAGGKKVSKTDKAKAKKLANATMGFETAWKEGMSAAKGFKASSAITQLTRAKKLDSTISSAYQSKIKKELGKQHAYLANTAYAAGNFAKAGTHARKALAHDSSQAAAKKIYDEIRVKAKMWLDEAKQVSESNPDKAMSLLRRVTGVFSRSDSEYTQAYTLLNDLAKAQEEDEEE